VHALHSLFVEETSRLKLAKQGERSVLQAIAAKLKRRGSVPNLVNSDDFRIDHRWSIEAFISRVIAYYL
jgi:hypothetical protein